MYVCMWYVCMYVCMWYVRMYVVWKFEKSVILYIIYSLATNAVLTRLKLLTSAYVMHVVTYVDE